MNQEIFRQMLQLCEASNPESQEFCEFAPKVTATLYAACNGVGLTIPSIEAVALRDNIVQARTVKGDLYVVQLSEIFAVHIEGKAQPKTQRKAGFT